MVRSARMGDVKQIYTLLQHFADKDLLLGRSLSSLYDQLRDFKVVFDANDDNLVIGACALHICWDDLAEVRSLAVAEAHQGKGIGAKLVKASLEDAEKLGIHRIFTLTYQPDFFRDFGFRDIDKGELPHKVWSDCIQCSKFPDCNEEALIWEKKT